MPELGGCSIESELTDMQCFYTSQLAAMILPCTKSDIPKTLYFQEDVNSMAMQVYTTVSVKEDTCHHIVIMWILVITRTAKMVEPAREWTQMEKSPPSVNVLMDLSE